MMRRKQIVPLLTAAASFVVCAAFLFVLLYYAQPMKDGTYNLSMMWDESEASPADWVYDQKGWTVFTQEGETVTELTPDGYGGFTGIDFPGQTFYFSRIFQEELDSPALRIQASVSNLAVFLDGRLLYTDCPEQGGPIGSLALPTREWERFEPLVISLPQDYVGKTLTVAQSTNPAGSEKPGAEYIIYPCSITLYCGFAYESNLISESFQTAIPSVIFFLAGAFLLMVFVWSAFQDKADVGLACAAAAAFLWVSARMAETSFVWNYFGTWPVDVLLLSRSLSLTALLAFLTSRMSGRRRLIGWLLTGIQTAVVLITLTLKWESALLYVLQQERNLLSMVVLLAALGLGLWEWRNGSAFFRLFCPLAAAGVVLYGLTLAGAVLTGHPFAEEVRQQFLLGAASYFLHPLALLLIASTLLAAIAQVIQVVSKRWAETRLLIQRQELAQNSYQAMRAHQEQVMMLRHDMTKHYALLRQMTGETQVADYLDELMEQNEKIRPVIQSGNSMLDIILNGKLTTAADAGVDIQIVRTQAPEMLPLSDAELCSLIVNIMDNAVAAASAPGVEQPYIKLNLHIKHDFFVFSCANSATKEWMRQTEETFREEGHGLGLKIIRQISRRYGDLMEIESGPDYYKVILALPLGQSSK